MTQWAAGLIRLALSLTAIIFLSSQVQSQPYPSRPVRVIIPFPPGGPVDVLARAMGEEFRVRTGQPFIVENRPGGGTAIGATACKSAAPDGYTFCILTVSTIAINPFIEDNLAYDPEKDFAPVSNLVRARSILLLHNSVPANNIAELVAYSKQYPDKLSYASFGTGGAAHLRIEWMLKQTGASMLHVPFSGVAPAMLAFERGDVHLLGPVVTPQILEKIRSGGGKAILTQDIKRDPDLPDVPMELEAGLPLLKFDNWFGALAPSATPPDRIEFLSRTIVDIVKQPKFRAQYVHAVGMDLIADTPAEFGQSLAEQREKARELIEISGVKKARGK